MLYRRLSGRYELAGTWYTVCLRGADGLPQCTCVDRQMKNVCKHILALCLFLNVPNAAMLEMVADMARVTHRQPAPHRDRAAEADRVAERAQALNVVCRTSGIVHFCSFCSLLSNAVYIELRVCVFCA
jgi:hypothetical protein